MSDANCSTSSTVTGALVVEVVKSHDVEEEERTFCEREERERIEINDAWVTSEQICNRRVGQGSSVVTERLSSPHSNAWTVRFLGNEMHRS